MRYSLPVLVTALAVSSPANAQWLHQKGDDAFGSAPQLVGTARDGHAFAFRCTDKDDFSLAYMMPERVGKDGAAAFNLGEPKLLVIIDDKPKVTLEATIEEANGGQFMITSDDSDEALPVLQAAIGAQRRIAVAAELLGKVVYQKTFQTAGLKQQLSKLVKACKLQLPTS